LLHVARVANGELVHSNVIAWLLDPTARHGMGAALLAKILSVGWPDVASPDPARATVGREVIREFRIADIVVTAGPTTVVIENKVWSDESDRQCEDLYEIWSDGVSDVRFLLLTLDGHAPRQTKSQAAADAWRSLSYASLVSWLSERSSLPTTSPKSDGRPAIPTRATPSSAGTEAVRDIHRWRGRPWNTSPEPSTMLDDPRLQFFLEHEEQIRDWAALAPEVFDATEAILRELGPEIHQDPRIAAQAIRVGDEVKGDSFRAPVLFREGWCRTTAGVPDVGIGIGWDGRVDPAGVWRPSTLPYFGVRTAHQTDAGLAIEEQLRSQYKLNSGALTRAGVLYKKGSYWVVYRHTRSTPTWWQDIRAWRHAMASELINTWEHWAAVIDEFAS
jgi:hypothetical protein